MSRGGRWALLAATAIAALLGPASTALGGQNGGQPAADAPVRVGIYTNLDSPREPLTSVVVTVPASPANETRLRRLLATRSRFSPRYRAVLANALAARGILSYGQALQAVESARALPTVRIAKGTASIALETSRFPFWDEWDKPGVLELQPIDVPAGSQLEVALRTGANTPQSVSPLPDEDSPNGELRWEFGPGETSGARVHLSDPVSLDHRDLTVPIVYYLVGGLPFLFLLAIFWWSGGGGLRPRRALTRLGFAGVALALSGIAYYLYENQVSELGGESFRFFRALIPSLGVALFVALSLRRWKLALAALCVPALGFAYLMTLRGALETSHALTHVERSQFELGGACVLGALLLAMTLAAAWQWTLDLLPRGARTRLRASPWLPLALALAALVLVIMGQLLLTAAASSFRENFFEGEPGWGAELGSLLEVFPSVLANLARNISFTLLGIGLAGWLWSRARSTEVAFTAWREAAALGLLFATVVTGLGGAIDGYSVPLPFLLAVIAITVAVHRLAGSARVEVARRAETRASSKDLLERATRLATLRRRRHLLGEESVSGAVDEAAHAQRLQELGARREELLQAPAIATLPKEDRPREILALGLAGARGARQRLRVLGKRGWLILAVPIAYAFYVLIDRSAPGAVSVAQPFGLAFLTVALIDQMLMWPIAAWCFVVAMPLIPGRIGPVKGIVAGAFTAIPPGLASLVLDDAPDAGQWLFVAAELTLVFVAVGILLDFRSVRQAGGDLRRLGELYSITNVRAATAYLAPLALLLFSVIHGLASGNGASALEELVANATSLVPGGGH